MCSEKKELYPNYSAGLRLAMTEFSDFWQEARMEVYQPPVQVPVNPKREPQIPEVPAGRGKRARKNANKAAKLAALEEQIRQLQAGATTPSTPSSSKGDKGGKASGKSRGPKRVPDAEFLAHTKTGAGSRFCRFYNLSCGCNQDGCRFEHKCPLCNEEHRWVDRHYRH